MKRILVISVIMFSAGVLMAVDGYRATLCLENGNTVNVEYFGAEKGVDTYKLRGLLNGQQVCYDLSEISEVIFSEYKTKSYMTEPSYVPGDAIIVSKKGKRFSLTDASIGCHNLSLSRIYYCYLDPVTEAKMFSYSLIFKKIVSINIGDNVGSMKKNSATGEFFPAIYSFDPFTGQKLIWANPVK